MYQIIAQINIEHGVFLVQDSQDLRIYVKKVLNIYNLDVYKSLFENHIEGTPLIKELIKEGDKLIVIEEYISGVSLREKIDKGLLNPKDILSYILDICNILEKLHEHDKPIIHRDIKPTNIIITSYNKAVLLDFNAAKFYRVENEDTMLLGTKGYAAPEQYGFGSSTTQSDIYALGILFKEMLISLNSKDKKLLSICDKCTQLNPKERFKNVKEVKDALCHYEHPYNLASLKPVGFRSGKPLNMILATTGYIFIAFLCFVSKMENLEGTHLWFNRFGFFIIFVGLIFTTFDYMGIQSSFSLSKSKNPLVRLFGIVVMDAAVVIMLLVSWMILESIFFTQ